MSSRTLMPLLRYDSQYGTTELPETLRAAEIPEEETRLSSEDIVETFRLLDQSDNLDYEFPEIHKDYVEVLEEVERAEEEFRELSGSNLPDQFDHLEEDNVWNPRYGDFGFVRGKNYDEGSIVVHYAESTDFSPGHGLPKDLSKVKVILEDNRNSFVYRNTWSQDK